MTGNEQAYPDPITRSDADQIGARSAREEAPAGAGGHVEGEGAAAAKAAVDK